jgi:hypothetical protein
MLAIISIVLCATIKPIFQPIHKALLSVLKNRQKYRPHFFTHMSSITPQHLCDHEYFQLNNPEAAWQVQSGHMAICRLAMCNGQPTGERECFFTVNPGDVVFGVAPQSAQTDELVAIALEPTIVVPLPPA